MFSESDKELLKLAVNELVFKYSEARDKAISVGIPVYMEQMRVAIRQTSGIMINDILDLERRLLTIMENENLRISHSV
jgi:hypothetical protein